jgi:hypothetical protein
MLCVCKLFLCFNGLSIILLLKNCLLLLNKYLGLGKIQLKSYEAIVKIRRSRLRIVEP